MRTKQTARFKTVDGLIPRKHMFHRMEQARRQKRIERMERTLRNTAEWWMQQDLKCTPLHPNPVDDSCLGTRNPLNKYGCDDDDDKRIGRTRTRTRSCTLEMQHLPSCRKQLVFDDDDDDDQELDDDQEQELDEDAVLYYMYQYYKYPPGATRNGKVYQESGFVPL